MDKEAFFGGTWCAAADWFGAHPECGGFRFRLWAPHARAVRLAGDFSGWEQIPMQCADGVWECFVPGAKDYDSYKFCLTRADGRIVWKADPYAFHAATRPETDSKLAPLDYDWQDDAWEKSLADKPLLTRPLNIYEVHPGSWRRYADGNPFNYRKLADELAKYVSDMGYTAVELMPVTEYPLDDSWGYQCTGYFAPTSRYGTPRDFKYLVDRLHRAGLAVFLDWVPAHFCKDEQGLLEFDGTCLYEYGDSLKWEHEGWGTRVFDYGRPEVMSFLLSSARFWLEMYHIDGIRVDAVASMLYLDYGRQDGQWTPNIHGGRENLEAVEFLRKLNTMAFEVDPNVLMIAEESTAWPMVTGDAEKDGLGFSLKWNMGWMNDFLEYMKLDPYFRKFNHNKMTFSMSYAYSERYVLVLSHDEVVHLKCSMLEKMPGELPDKFRNLKAAYSFMNCHPGKKLLFMGQEFGQLREWSEERELDWFLLNEEPHKELQNYVHDLLTIYKKYPALYAGDNNPEGFEWINADDRDRSIFSFVRKSPTKRNNILYIVNFTPVDRPDYRVGVPKKKQYKLIMDENGLLEQPKTFKAVKQECDNREFSFAYPLPAYGVAIFTY